MTDKRLLRAAQMVRAGVAVADIGTDHAYLPVYLLQTGRCPRAVACDIGEGPASAARRTIAKAGLTDRIDVRVGDGLSVLTPGEVQDIVIAGMGGETIVSVLSAAPWLQDNAADYRLILQPMSKTVELRHWLLQNGFSVDEERLIEDGRHLYIAMRAHFDGCQAPSDELLFYTGALSAKEGHLYFQKEISHLKRRADGLLRGSEADKLRAAQLLTLAERLSAYATSGKEYRA